MNFKEAQTYLLAKPESEESFPFGADIFVYKLMGKVFAILSDDSDGVDKSDTARVNLKCNPDEALALRDVFDGVIPGYHMNKKHWNTVVLNSDIPDGEIQRQIDNSYALIFKGLPKAKQKYLQVQYSQKELGLN